MIHQNSLSNSKSTYLLQHANNPVHWQPWSEQIKQTAIHQDSLLIISIGYAACHWCHVMEKETFTNEDAAKVMNNNYINIKIDREEHPDLDMMYMQALQLMTNQGGWPLNIIALPDGTPIWGATYVKPENWIQVLHQINQLYRNDPDKVKQYGTQLNKHIALLNTTINQNTNTPIDFTDIIEEVLPTLDHKNGGFASRQKFMMPTQLNALLNLSTYTNNNIMKQHVNKTLLIMAKRGIFDQVEGGFYRYTVDDQWHIPHFEKMLCDNALLVELYAKAYKSNKNDNLKHCIKQTIQFLNKTLKTNNSYYSSIDADSYIDGQKTEGGYYTFSEDELRKHLHKDFEIFASYYSVSETFKWENKYVLHNLEKNSTIAKVFGITEEKLKHTIQHCIELLKKSRTEKELPTIDKKIIASYNAMLARAFAYTYEALEDDIYKTYCINTIEYIINTCITPEGTLKRTSYLETSYLEDYAHTISALLKTYEITSKETYLNTAKSLIDTALDLFLTPEKNSFYFTPNSQEITITKPIEKIDNVLPSSNSVMAGNLWLLNQHFGNSYYLTIFNKMLQSMQADIEEHPNSYLNWLNLFIKKDNPFFEVIIAGKQKRTIYHQLKALHIPNALILMQDENSKLPLHIHRTSKEEIAIYICKENACSAPITNIDEAIKMITFY